MAEPARVLALDLASRCGVCDGIFGGTPKLSFVDFHREGDTDRDKFGRCLRWIARYLQDNRPDLLVIEAPVPKYDSSLVMGYRAIVLAFAFVKNVRATEVEVKTWRKYALGNGNLKRATAKARCVELCRQLNWHVPLTKGGDPDHNAAEAGGLWLWGCATVNAKDAIRHEPLFTFRANASRQPMNDAHHPFAEVLARSTSNKDQT